jgi:hypothetical protein
MKEHQNKSSRFSSTLLHLSFIERCLYLKTVFFVPLHFVKCAVNCNNRADKETWVFIVVLDHTHLTEY